MWRQLSSLLSWGGERHKEGGRRRGGGKRHGQANITSLSVSITYSLIALWAIPDGGSSSLTIVATIY